jgi:hypothetical protein
MFDLIKRFGGLVKGYITGFDRIVFKGMILPLMFAGGAMSFCHRNRILNKEYKPWMMHQSKALVEAVDQYAKDSCGRGIEPIPSWRIRKEELARNRQKAEGIDAGLIGVWSCLESCLSYRAHFCPDTGFPQLRSYNTRCKHLYFYLDHSEFGFMNIRLQTWFPYSIQICLNGREWLRRHLERQGIDFLSKGNKFLYIADYEAAQQLLDCQLDAQWTDVLNAFVPIAFPTMEQTLGDDLSYYWTMWQSEWATDLIFASPSDLNPIMNSLLNHAIMTGTSTRILKYLDRPVTGKGNPDPRAKDNVSTRVMDFNDGLRVRHWVDRNSVKVYNEQNVLRVELTMNDSSKFKVYRHKQGQPTSEPKSRLPLRKGVADITLRAKVSQEANERFMKDLATLQDKTPVCQLLEDVTRSRKKSGKRVRAIDPTGKDRELLQAISDPAFRISGLTNKMIRQRLQGKKWAKGRTEKQLSARISRHLALLRDHGIIRKLPKQHRYQLTDKGVKLTTALNALLAASTEQLIDIAA